MNDAEALRWYRGKGMNGKARPRSGLPLDISSDRIFPAERRFLLQGHHTFTFCAKIIDFETRRRSDYIRAKYYTIIQDPMIVLVDTGPFLEIYRASEIDEQAKPRISIGTTRD